MARKTKKYNINLIKQTLSYSVIEIAELFNLHKRTVQTWLQEGLPKIDNKRPFLVLGSELKEFISRKQKKRKKKCKQDEFYCCKCREVRQSRNNLVSIKILNEKSGLIKGICNQCNTKINKIFPIKKLGEIKEIFVVQRIDNKDLNGFSGAIVNTDLKEVTEK